MKKYKLLKDLPDYKSGTIFTAFYAGIEKDENKRYSVTGNYLDTCYSPDLVENNPEWFEEVKDEFKKEFKVEKIYRPGEKIGDVVTEYYLKEYFETKEQAEAMKALKEHIYKFDEPRENFFYLKHNIEWVEGFDYGDDIRDNIAYHAGYVLNTKITEKDREERIKLLKAVYSAE